MARNMVGVKGAGDTVEKLGNEVMQVMKKAKNQGVGATAKAKMALTGHFGIDRQGNLGIIGNIVGAGPNGPIEAEVGAEIDAENDWANKADGTVSMVFEVEASCPADGE